MRLSLTIDSATPNDVRALTIATNQAADPAPLLWEGGSRCPIAVGTDGADMFRAQTPMMRGDLPAMLRHLANYLQRVEDLQETTR